MSTVRFRRKLIASDSSDRSITGKMILLWALGSDFESPLSLGYHKLSSKNRGFAIIDSSRPNLPGKNSCTGLQLYPPNCNSQNDQDCDYKIKWIRNGDNLEFELTAKIKPGSWTGIGMSKNGLMVRSSSNHLTTRTNENLTYA